MGAHYTLFNNNSCSQIPSQQLNPDKFGVDINRIKIYTVVTLNQVHYTQEQQSILGMHKQKHRVLDAGPALHNNMYMTANKSDM